MQIESKEFKCDVPNIEDNAAFNAIIESILETRFKDVKNQKLIETRLRHLFYLANLYHVTAIKVDPSNGTPVLKDFELNSIDRLKYIEFINMFIENSNAAYLLECQKLTREDIEDCIADKTGDITEKFAYLELEICCDYFKKDKLTFPKLCDMTPSQLDNILNPELHKLFLEEILLFNDILTLTHENRKILIQPAIYTWLLEKKIQAGKLKNIAYNQVKHFKPDEYSLAKLQSLLKMEKPDTTASVFRLSPKK